MAAKKYIYGVSTSAETFYCGEVVLTKREAAIVAKVMNHPWLNEYKESYSPSCGIDEKPLREATEAEIAAWDRMCSGVE